MNYDKLAFLINSVLAANILCALSSIIHWWFLRRRGVAVTKVEFMYGPGAIKFQLLGAEVRIGSIPNGSSVTSDVPLFRAQPLAWRLAAMLIGPAMLIVLSIIVLGPADAVQQLLHGFTQLLQGMLQPKSHAQHLIARFHEVYNTSYLEALGVLSAKVAAASLLPLFGPAFAQIVRQFFRDDESKSLKNFFTLHGFCALALGACWAYAVVYHALLGN